MSAPSNTDWAGALIDALVAGGARHAVLSPGSRSTPVVLALHRMAAARQVTLHDVLDERSAGFFGLGLARMTGQPVLLACTSGTAGAHYLPALIEASHDRLPLIALTADRPPELHGLGAPQTTEQRGFFGSHVRLQADAGLPDETRSLEAMHDLATRALDSALGSRPGPVHLNLPFRKPLWDEATTPRPAPPTRSAPGRATLGAAELDDLAERSASVRRGLIVCGPGDLGTPGRGREAQLAALRTSVGRLADALGWPVLIDAASSLRTAPLIPGAVTVGDTLSRAEAFAEAQGPELILRVGQIPTSTPLRRWLARHGEGRTLLVDASGDRHDPDHLAAQVVHADPATTLSDLAERAAALPTHLDPDWITEWTRAAAATEQAQHPNLTAGPLWSGATARVLAKALPEGGLLHVASSLAVRALDAFGGPTAAGTQITANRGVNGIDGTLATAFGEAAAWEGPTAVLLGDLAFLHDLGSLAALGTRTDGSPLVIVVLDNAGGGLFDHLPIAEHPTAYEAHFATPPRADIAALARAAAGAFVAATDVAGLRHALDEAFARPGVTVVHVPFDREEDLARHRETWALGVAACEGGVA